MNGGGAHIDFMRVIEIWCIFSGSILSNKITEIGEKREWYSRILSRTGENGMFYDENRSGLLFLLLFFS